MENRQKFLNEIAIKLNLKEPSDWGKVSTRYITQSGGSTLLQNYYNGSLFQCLQSVYKGILILNLNLFFKKKRIGKKNGF
jgi:hypothetical protein